MFTKFGNNRKRIIAKIEARGFRPAHTLNSQTRLFKNFINHNDGTFSKVSVSYRKRNPMVEIKHRYPDGSIESFQRVLLNKRSWREVVAYLTPETPPAAKKKED